MHVTSFSQWSDIDSCQTHEGASGGVVFHLLSAIQIHLHLNESVGVVRQKLQPR